VNYALNVPTSAVVPLAERHIDEVLTQSFPASDPPSWTPGDAETNPADHVLTANAFTAGPRLADAALAAAEAPTGRSLFDVVSPLGGAALALLVPLFIVLLPVALLIRLLLGATGWPNWLPHFRD